MEKSGFLIMGTHLFPPKYLQVHKLLPHVMIEDENLCRHVQYHKHKLIYTLSSMRLHAESLRKSNFSISYYPIIKNYKNQDFFTSLWDFITTFKLKKIISFDIEDRFFAKQLESFFQKKNIEWKKIISPLFINPIEDFSEYLESSKPFLKTYYQRQRKNHKILVDSQNKPLGGQWSFDVNNRKMIPATLVVPHLPTIKKMQ